MSYLMLAFFLQLGTYPPDSSFDARRAERNYTAILNGSARLGDLTVAEQIEVRQLQDHLRKQQTPPRDTRAECMRDNATSPDPSPLERSVLDLKCSQRPD